jgi:hypothetical protein
MRPQQRAEQLPDRDGLPVGEGLGLLLQLAGEPKTDQLVVSHPRPTKKPSQK